MRATASEGGTVAGTGGTGVEARGTEVELYAGGLETEVGGPLLGLSNPRCTVWPHLGLSDQAAAG